MVDYNEMIYNLAKYKSDRVIRNHGDEQCVATLAQLINSSNSHVRLYNGCLHEEIYWHEDVKIALKSFLETRNGTLSIITEESIEDNNPVSKYLTCIRNNYPNRISITQNVEPWLRYRFQANGEEKNPLIHFATGDDAMYRIETDKENRHAFVCFNDAKLTETLVDFHNEKMNLTA